MKRRIKSRGHRKGKAMPMGLQIRMVRLRFERLNPDADFGDIDLGLLDKKCSLPENRQLLREAYPRFEWEIPIDTKKGSLRDTVYWEQPRHTDSMVIHVGRVLIKPFKIKPKRRSKSGLTVRRHDEKLYGRIQVTVRKKWIGREAIIIVRIPKE